MMDVAMGRCQDCHYWQREVEWKTDMESGSIKMSVDDVGICELSTMDDVPMAWPVGGLGRSSLLTTAEYGCVQFKSRQDSIDDNLTNVP